MIYVSLASVGGLVAITLALVGALVRLMRQHAREREALLARLMHLAGHTWESPPSYEAPEPEPDLGRYTRHPDALDVDVLS